MNNILCQNRVIYPSKVVCIGRNYVEHIKELNNTIPDEMVFFIKPNSAIAQQLIFAFNEQACHYEAEISFMIEEGKISAVGFGLDLTLRAVQSRLKKRVYLGKEPKHLMVQLYFQRLFLLIIKRIM